ncbi:MAG: ABC transporter permease [Desulfobacteraceae bacterium]|nr:ABC transporter permease [Desulfobacteraceae bacterium]
MSLQLVKQLWYYRGFIFGSVKREFQSRYRNSLFGSLWTVLNPLASISIYLIIFSRLMNSRLPGTTDSMAYGIYLCSGILTWGLFSDIINRCLNVFVDNANLIKKLSFPRICLPIIIVISAGLTFIIAFGLFLIFLLLAGKFPARQIWALPVILLIQMSFSVGLGIILGIANVFFRDVSQFIGIFLQLWFWFTPIVYPITILPAFIQKLVMVNPMTHIMAAYQTILVNGSRPQWINLIWVAIFVILLCFVGVRMYQQRCGEIVDEL